MRKSSIDDLIKKANEIHNGKYMYDKFVYHGNKINGIITCPLHGDFEQSMDAHIHQKSGCPECGKIRRNKKNTKFTYDMLFKNDSDYNFGYDYHLFVYNGYDIKSSVVCPLHGVFPISWHKLKYGHGCPICGNYKNYSELRFFEMLKSSFNDEVEYQKRFKWLGRQSIDFYLPQYNIGIEYQGRQHFYSKTKFNYNDTIRRDRNKLELCISNGIKLYYFTFEDKFLKDFSEYKIYTNYNELIDKIKRDSQ